MEGFPESYRWARTKTDADSFRRRDRGSTTMVASFVPVKSVDIEGGAELATDHFSTPPDVALDRAKRDVEDLADFWITIPITPEFEGLLILQRHLEEGLVHPFEPQPTVEDVLGRDLCVGFLVGSLTVIALENGAHSPVLGHLLPEAAFQVFQDLVEPTGRTRYGALANRQFRVDDGEEPSFRWDPDPEAEHQTPVRRRRG